MAVTGESRWRRGVARGRITPGDVYARVLRDDSRALLHSAARSRLATVTVLHSVGVVARLPHNQWTGCSRTFAAFWVSTLLSHGALAANHPFPHSTPPHFGQLGYPAALICFTVRRSIADSNLQISSRISSG